VAKKVEKGGRDFDFNLLGFYNHFLYKFYVLRRFSCLICMDVIAHHMFFGLNGLFDLGST
jgi:hypothetical protein